MGIRDTLLACLVVFVWGVSFVAIKLGLTEMPPFAFCAWRFILASFPLVFFVPRPKVSWTLLLGYGFLIGVVQFGLLFLAIAVGMPAGLSSVIIQAQVFVTIGLSVLLMKERVRPIQLVGAAIAAAGLAIIGSAKLATGLGASFLMVLAASVAWGAGNVVAKRAGNVDLLGFIAWSSLAAPLPLALLSLAFEPAHALWVPVTAPTWTLWLAIVVMAYGATVFGFGTWSRLLTRHPSAIVAPYALLIPVFGMASSALVFGERLNALQATGAILVFAGVALAAFGAKLFTIVRSRFN